MKSNRTMQALVTTKYGEPDVLRLAERPVPAPLPGTVVVRVRAIGLNHAELYLRRGDWGEVAEIDGIECAGTVEADGDGRLEEGQCVVAFVGGMGRSIDGAYAEYVRVPSTNVVPVETSLSFEALAAIPEVYATAWACLRRQLRIARGEVLVVRGATSALGQAAVNIARHEGLRVLGTTRSRERFALLESIGATPLLDAPDLAAERRGSVDGVLDLVGARTLKDSLALAKAGTGRVCFAGFLGGFGPIPDFDPLVHMPSGVALSFFGSAFEFGTKTAPLSDIPIQKIVDRVEAGDYRAAPAQVFTLETIPDAHRLMESGKAGGKLVARVKGTD